MMKRIIMCCFILVLSMPGMAQNKVEWSRDYQITLADFASGQTRIGTEVNSLVAGIQIEFSYHMSMAQFMFTRNFNGKVNNTFDKDISVLTATDHTIAEHLANFADYQFDLCELYSRKFRKELHEKKGTFSNPEFFQSSYDSMQREYASRNADAATQTKLGTDIEKLQRLQLEVLKEIDQLAEYCKDCKPANKKKK